MKYHYAVFLISTQSSEFLMKTSSRTLITRERVVLLQNISFPLLRYFWFQSSSFRKLSSLNVLRNLQLIVNLKILIEDPFNCCFVVLERKLLNVIRIWDEFQLWAWKREQFSKHSFHWSNIFINDSQPFRIQK